ncbi:phosphoglucosamine mutase [Lujinxingia litoralis]|uniref:Phosphoglucosamine mutase n=1 Tax=Lujinxingia litoralis TaxID=2211119 RepID=A0A328C9H6_9DELT|nr:phosphoglucosamine mutase [Lujinxingia litoralis]RAL21620.1 phosphoglucosamine mutase [Lujinxingia litoralis]
MTTRQLFGTDGIRGVANQYPMTADLAVRLGQAIARHFKCTAGERPFGHRTRIVIGKDTRISGYMFESGLAAGITSMGADVQLVGPLPTPGISFLTTGMRADAGIVISASHNAYQDNGIKIFASDGFKLPDQVELAIEDLVLGEDNLQPNTDRIGKASRIDDATGRYIVFLKNTFPRDLTLDGLRVVVDCANGAAYKVAPAVLRELGAEVFTLGVDPDGYNINQDCGSLHPHNTARRVRETRADVGITLDGDADRLILIDENGDIVDGDGILALCAIHLHEQGKLADNTLVTTVMSNVGLEVALQKRGIRLVRTAVGDRYVVEEMRKGGYTLGGEQSGHMVFLEHSTTGDGMLAALQVLAIMQRHRTSLSKLARVMTPFPQVLLNLEVSEKPPLEELEAFQKMVRQVESELAGEGRVLARYSGTESKARIMVEGPDPARVRTYAEELQKTLRQLIGA